MQALILNRLYTFYTNLRYGYLTLIFLIFFGNASNAQSSAIQEYQIKALFLYNFTQFVEWPPRVFSTSDGPLIVGILGPNPFGNYLEQTISTEKYGNRPIRVKYCNSVEEAATCHLVFLNITESAKLKNAMNTLKTRSVLTISEATPFIKFGGIIRFYNKGNKIRFQINPEAAKEVDLVLSSKLMRLAEIVTK